MANKRQNTGVHLSYPIDSNGEIFAHIDSGKTEDGIRREITKNILKTTRKAIDPQLC
jgi:hypothetical protein